MDEQYRQDIEYKPELDDTILGELVDRMRSVEPLKGEIELNVEEIVKKITHHLLNLEDFVVHLKRKKPKRYSSKTIIVDDLAFYVPYHYDLNRYGIYFRLPQIILDFRSFYREVATLLEDSRFARILSDDSEANLLKLNKARKDKNLLRNSLFVEYLVYNYARLMAHHIFEDISLILEFMGKGKYSVVDAREEDSYCEYVAYTTLERYMPGVLQRSKKAERLISIFYPIAEGFKWDKVVSLNFATTKLLYAHNLIRQRPRPYISGKIRLKMEVLFRALWKLHYTFEAEIHALKGKPIIQRILITTF